MAPRITAVHLSAKHSFSKVTRPAITLLTGEGVQGDAHCGVLVRHRYMVRKDPAQPNLCQVHLLQHELLDEFGLQPGELGENITTRDFDLLTLPTGTRLGIGDAVLEVTGLRNPCNQINAIRPGLMKECFVPKSKSPRTGIMAIVVSGGTIRPHDTIHVTLPPEPHHPLVCV